MIEEWADRTLEFKKTGDPLVPLMARFGGDRLALRLNDFPAEDMWTLLVNDESVGNFNDWPPAWRRPESW